MFDANPAEQTNAVQTPGAGWLDPGLVLAVAPGGSRVVTLPPATPVLLLGGNPQRVAFTLIKSSALAQFPRVGPSPAVQTFGLREDGTVDARTFVLQDWLSLIVGEWWAYSTAGGDVQVWEFQPSF